MRPDRGYVRRCHLCDVDHAVVRKKLRATATAEPRSCITRRPEISVPRCAILIRTLFVIWRGRYDRSSGASSGNASRRMCDRGGGAARAPARHFQHSAVEVSGQPDQIQLGHLTGCMGPRSGGPVRVSRARPAALSERRNFASTSHQHPGGADARSVCRYPETLRVDDKGVIVFARRFTRSFDLQWNRVTGASDRRGYWRPSSR